MRLTIVSSTVWATNAAVAATSVPSSLSSVADSAFSVHQHEETPAASILQLAMGHSNHDPRPRYRRQRRLKSLAKERMRQLQQKLQGDDLVECIPPVSSSSSTQADVGILSCAIGKYCMESSQSTLGGYCHNQVHIVEEAVMQQQVIKNPKFGRRDLQDDNNDDGTPFLELAQDICSMAATVKDTGDESDALTCDTCEVSDSEYTAKFDCTYATDCYSLGSLCNDTQIEFCESHTIEGTLAGKEDFKFKSCYTLTKPKDFSYCITYYYSPDPNQDATCDIEIEGVKCNSCTLLFQGAVTGDWCRTFDCENAPLGISASICDYNILEAFTTGHLYDQLPCEDGCNLCGKGGSMTDSATKQFTIPRVATLNCFQTQLQAMTGKYNRQQCLELEGLVDEPCNCEEASPTASPKSDGSKQTILSISGMAAAVASVVAWM